MKRKTTIIIIILLVIVILFILLAASEIAALRVAHSSFDNYYKFRGCVQLINRTDDAGFCKLNSGAVIKIVEYNGKWYLDGDLPVSCGIFECP